MNCPHATAEDPVCDACHEALLDALTECADITRALAECKHARVTAPGGGELLWCNDCGAFQWTDSDPGVWGIPKSVGRSIALDERTSLRGVAASRIADDSGEKIVTPAKSSS